MRQVELVYFRGCPNAAVLQQSTKQAVEKLGADWQFSMVDLEALAPQDPRRGYGSPSVLLDGQEVFGEPAASGTQLSCRAYAGGVPTAETMIRALTAAAKRK